VPNQWNTNGIEVIQSSKQLLQKDTIGIYITRALIFFFSKATYPTASVAPGVVLADYNVYGWFNCA